MFFPHSIACPLFLGNYATLRGVKTRTSEMWEEASGMRNAPRVWESCCVSWVSPDTLTLTQSLHAELRGYRRHSLDYISLFPLLCLCLWGQRKLNLLFWGNQILTKINLIMCCWRSKRSLKGKQIEFFKEFRVSIIKHLDKAVFLKRHVKLSITWDI